MWFLLLTLPLLTAAFSPSTDTVRRSIIFKPNSLDVFYCPVQFPSGAAPQMFVKARSLDKLCEYRGKPLPDHHVSDCFGDIDETEFACAEKHRVLALRKQAAEAAANEIAHDL